MSTLTYLTLDLFLYDLRGSVLETESDLQSNQRHFLRKLPTRIHSCLDQLDKTFDVEYLELLPAPHIEVFTENIPFPMEGYYYPVCLGDTYGLLLDTSVDNQTTAQPTHYLAGLKSELERRLNEEMPTLGQTWMVSGWLSDLESDNTRETARSCYAALYPEASWNADFQGEGVFLGAYVYELWQYRLHLDKQVRPESVNDFLEDRHVVIIVYPNHKSALKEAPRFYSDWMRLFHYRQKILWAYGQGWWLSKTVRRHFIEIKTGIRSLEQNHNKKLNARRIRDTLERTQRKLLSSTDYLISLESQRQTISTNLTNYQKRLSAIVEKTGGESDLSFLEQFGRLVEDKYLLQTTNDYESLMLALRLLDSSLTTLRSRMDVERANRDRIFQNVITIVGVGLGVASLVESSNGFCEYFTTLVGLQSSSICAVPLLCSVSFGIIASALTWLFVRLWP